ncbi:MAG: SDR family NAD(P)-dependent oxidoreductase, partial [Roseomonas sp.]|nr:SDR family NAD(P)-dependent oxidoreductase [Roseomonas sp.]
MAYAPFDLSGKVALITGGNSGIGLGMARALAEAGADIAIWGSNAAKNAAALESLKPLGVRLYAAICDISDETAVETAFAETVEKLGRVDACFANAGTYGHAARFTALETAEWQRVMRINLDGAFYTLRAAARHMVERGGGGSLVATASLAAIEGAARNAHYG